MSIIERIYILHSNTSSLATFYMIDDGGDYIANAPENPAWAISPSLVDAAVKAIENCPYNIGSVNFDGFARKFAIMTRDVSLWEAVGKPDVKLSAGVNGDCILSTWVEDGVTYDAVHWVEG